MKYKNLTLIGTSHIAHQSLKDVENAIISNNADIVCVELDRRRYHALTQNIKGRRVSLGDIRKIGFKGFVFAIIGGYIQKKLGKLVGIDPGSEMLKAINLAKKHNAKIALIDQDIEITLKRFSKELTWKERWRFLEDLFKGFVLKKNKFKIDLSKVPEKALIRKLIKQIKERYPNVHKVLIEERNEYMASKLARIMYLHPEKSVVAIIGAGHEEEMMQIIKNKKIDVIRL